MNGPWSLDELRSRIRDPQRRERYPGGSPNPSEVAAYAAAVPPDATSQTAVVLGMTPELRAMALTRFRRVVTIESNRTAIELYRAWVDETDRHRETIMQGNWFDASQLLSEPVSAVVGDGIFCTLDNLEEYRRLLRSTASILRPRGHLIVRKLLIPDGFRPEAYRPDILIQRFRRGELDEAEFGLSMRMVGHYACCYDPTTYLLDNKKLFTECARDVQSGLLTEREHHLIRRYRFSGKNSMIPQPLWEALLTECGFAFTEQTLRGKNWYVYYKVYACSLHT